MKSHILILALTLICLSACHKPAEQSGSTSTIRLKGIKYYGSPFAGCNICFEAVGEGIESYQWSTGDGATSTAATFCHTYTGACTDTVKLFINNNAAYSASYEMHIYNAPVAITTMLAATRTWRMYEGIAYPNGQSTITYKRDTVFEVVYVDPATLRIGDDTLRLGVSFNSAEYDYYKQLTNSLGLNDSWALRLRRSSSGDDLVYGKYHNLPSGATEVREYRNP